ncbi:MAG: class I SAM-dependent methyltransferase [Candidatus Thermoplasmatota archaeon]
MNAIPEKDRSTFEKYVRVINGHKRLEHACLLDIGCANGVFIDLVQGGSTCYGIDYDTDAVAAYKQKHLKSSVEECDLNDDDAHFPFENVQFDLITCFDVVEHLSNFNTIKMIIRNHLKNDGLFVVTTPNANALEKKINSNYSGEYDSSHTMLFTPYTLDFFLRRTGLKKVMLYTPYTFMFFPNLVNRTLMYGGQIFGIYGK